MTTRNLQYLFAPQSVAVIGATGRSGSVGAAVTRNLLDGGFRGELRLVNPKHDRVGEHPCYPDVRSLDIAPQLAVICTPPDSVPGLIAELGAKGTKAAVVLTAGLGRATDGGGRTLSQAMLDAANPHLLRILGSNCVGLLSPHIGLNASFAHEPALPGHLAFVSQSGALTTALLDWARARRIGFSHFVSLGESADVDFGDVLDYLATDAETTAILMYVEAIKHARKFMSAARAAARNKPIIVVKAGRAPEGARAAASHTGALAGSDAVYEAAFRRAGALRVATTSDLFVAAETLACAKPLSGERIAILTNGGGPGVLAADAVCLGGGQLATLSDATFARLDSLLPATWSHANPVDISGDASTTRYVESLRILATDAQIDALLFITVRCVPPQNKPLPAEIATCNRFLRAQIDALPALSAIAALGRIAHDAVLAALAKRKSHYSFGHGAVHDLGGLRLFDSYHCSRYNTNTGVLTPAMFEAVFAAVRAHIDASQASTSSASRPGLGTG